MAANLKGRLSRLKAREEAAVPGRSAPASRIASEPSPAGRASARGDSSQPRPPFLEDWDEAAPLVWTRILSYPDPLPESLDPEPFAPLRRGAGSCRAPLPAVRGGDAGAPRIVAQRLRFFDLETTGLSGGTGTIAFLASIGRRDEGGRFSIAQVFLEDFPGEAAFVGIVLGLLGDDPVIVSYNGKAFDLPLLRTRCVMNGYPPPSFAQIDALFASRRLWRRSLGEASLGAVEREVLGIDRGPDVPGAVIPELWLAYARSAGEGRAEANPLMPLVLSHNASDVASLAGIVAAIASIFEAPMRLVGVAQLADRAATLADRAATLADRAALGRSLLAIGRSVEGEALLDSAARGGDPRAALMLFRRYRLTSRPDAAAALAELLPPDFPAAVEEAKLYERKALDLESALAWARRAVELAPSEELRESALARVARLERKLESRPRPGLP